MNYWEKIDYVDEERGEGEFIGVNKLGIFSIFVDGIDWKWWVYGGGIKVFR